MAEKNTISILAKELALSLRPLTEGSGGASGPGEIPGFFLDILEEAGITLEQAVGSETIQALRNILGKISTAYQRISPTIERADLPELAEIPQLLQAFTEVFNALKELSGLKLKAYQEESVLVEVQDLGAVLLEYLIADYLQSSHVGVFNFLVQIGTIGHGDPVAKEIEKRLTRLRLSALASFIRDPKIVLTSLYGWGGDDFNIYGLLDPLGLMLQNLGLPAVFAYPDEQEGQALGWDPRAEQPDFQLRVPLIKEESGVSLQAGFAVLPLRSDTGGINGFAIVPYGVSHSSMNIDVGKGWKFHYDFAGNVTGRYGIVVHFHEVQVQTLAPGETNHASELRITAALERTTVSEEKMLLLGQGDLGVIEVGSIGVKLEFLFAKDDATFSVELPITNAQASMKASQGDGFLQKILPPDGLNAPFSLTVGWSNKRGLYFQGGAGLEVTLPIHKDVFGVLRIDSLRYRVQAIADDHDASIAMMLATSFAVRLGPITANVEGVGMEAQLTFPPDGGNLGPANLTLTFKPPDGAGLTLDASAISGGGYLFFDPKNEQYVGFLQLEVKGGISLRAVGLLTTRLPDGSKGFSLLVIISADFPPIQLGFGFTLNGVGGLLGANRTMVLEVLRAGIRNRTLDSALSPRNPEQNAPQIISDLQGIFPPAAGRFVIGPMAKLGWGTPTILTIEIGILLELPAPVRLAILGRLRMVLPREEAALVILQMDVLGTIDFDKGDVSIDATLYDSRIAQFVLTGDMAMRLNWGASPAFALSAGGFHPRFLPPPNFPALDRLAISLAAGDNPRLRLESYLAVTSNTIQFGARLDVYAAIDAGILGTFSASAYLGFDALIQFDPFQFLVEIGGGVAIRHNDKVLFAADLYLALSGPTPWHAWGEAVFDFLGKRRIAFDFTVGDEPPPLPLPLSNPLVELRTALTDQRNWSAQLPGDGHMAVTLRQLSPSGEVLMHPLGDLTVRQRVVPLEIEIAKFGNTTPVGPRFFQITAVLFDGQAVQSGEPVRDAFVPSQFLNLSDEEKLTSPAFTQWTSGRTRIGTEAVSYGEVVGEDFGYDTMVIDKKEMRSRPSDVYTIAHDVMSAMAAREAAGRSVLRTTGSARYAGPRRKVILRDPEFVAHASGRVGLSAGLGLAEGEAVRSQEVR